MYRLALLFSVLFAINATAKINNNSNEFNTEKSELEKIVFAKVEDSASETVEINDIDVIELEEEVELGFDTITYLPENFNALKGTHDLDWSTIELIEIEEDVELGFDAQKYLPQGFDAHQGEHI